MQVTDLSSKAVANPQVVCTELGKNEIVLLHLETQACFTLNASGRTIWQMLDKPTSLLDVATGLEAQFNVTPALAQQSVLTLITELVAAGLVSIEDSEPR
jgi:hypothetical protein